MADSTRQREVTLCHLGFRSVTSKKETGYRPVAYRELTRREWSLLRSSMPMTVHRRELQDMQGLGDLLSVVEVEEVYLPLARLISLHVSAFAEMRRVVGSFLGHGLAQGPFVIGVAGSVGVGKSTIARVLRTLLSRLPGAPAVDLVTTDGFLFPNAELERRGALQHKGFPESYNLPALVGFLSAVREGEQEVPAPVYSHLAHDVVPGAAQMVKRPDILILEGLNVLQHAARPQHRAPAVLVSDFLDFTIYVDADREHIRQWYIDRFLALRTSSFRDPASYFHRYASLTVDEAVGTAARIWEEINLPNLVQNIAPTRGRARVVLEKGADHCVRRVRLRRF